MGIAMRCCLFVRGSRCVSRTSLELATLAQVPSEAARILLEVCPPILCCLVWYLCVLQLSAVLFGTCVPSELVRD